VVMPASALELASLCYEIGNKHLPLFLGERRVAGALRGAFVPLDDGGWLCGPEGKKAAPATVTDKCSRACAYRGAGSLFFPDQCSWLIRRNDPPMCMSDNPNAENLII